ncbi:hypothetical protein ACFL02_02080 [Planctomycetota bacterium]
MVEHVPHRALGAPRAGACHTQDEIAAAVGGWTSDIDKRKKEDRQKTIFDMWLACNTLEHIAKAVELTHKQIDNILKEFVILVNLPKLQKLSAEYNDARTR